MQVTRKETRGDGVHGFRDIGIYDGPHGEENLLLQEITHRINNELASTIGFVTLAARQTGSEEVKIALAGVIQHINDFARVLQVLQMPDTDHFVDAPAYLHELCQAISRARLQYRNIELLLQVTPLRLGAQRCWRMGMIVSELIANASRHAFHGNGGRVQVSLSQRGTLVECKVTDDGSAFENVRSGQGTKILRALAGDLNGSIDHRFARGGTAVTLSFPLLPTETPRVDRSLLGFG